VCVCVCMRARARGCVFDKEKKKKTKIACAREEVEDMPDGFLTEGGKTRSSDSPGCASRRSRLRLMT
ncbi:hypothetical protein, partial [Salmonella enterica]|uniref:hypothetical protein n=1 Tax=Salmonella enterica TaxID=28901 RepID=UPI0035260C3E